MASSTDGERYNSQGVLTVIETTVVVRAAAVKSTRHKRERRTAQHEGTRRIVVGWAQTQSTTVNMARGDISAVEAAAKIMYSNTALVWLIYKGTSPVKLKPYVTPSPRQGWSSEIKEVFGWICAARLSPQATLHVNFKPCRNAMNGNSCQAFKSKGTML